MEPFRLIYLATIKKNNKYKLQTTLVSINEFKLQSFRNHSLSLLAKKQPTSKIKDEWCRGITNNLNNFEHH